MDKEKGKQRENRTRRGKGKRDKGRGKRDQGGGKGIEIVKRTEKENER